MRFNSWSFPEEENWRPVDCSSARARVPACPSWCPALHISDLCSQLSQSHKPLPFHESLTYVSYWFCFSGWILTQMSLQRLSCKDCDIRLACIFSLALLTCMLWRKATCKEMREASSQQGTQSNWILPTTTWGSSEVVPALEMTTASANTLIAASLEILKQRTSETVPGNYEIKWCLLLFKTTACGSNLFCYNR